MRFSRKKVADWESDEYKRARFHYLLQILYGESCAIDYCSTMSTFAPSTEARDFLLQQQKEENTHLELLTDVVSKMERPVQHISLQMDKLHKIAEPALKEKDWAVCILIQNFIIEGLAITLCRQQGEYGDNLIHRTFATILKDEVRHVAFGVRELKKVLESDTDGTIRKRIIRVQRRALYHSIMLFKDLAPDAGALGMQWDDLAEKVLREHMERIKEAGLHLPFFDRVFLKGAIAFFVVI